MTREDVMHAVRVGQERGQPLTARNVRAVLGVGSHRDILKYLHALEAAPPDAPLPRRTRPLSCPLPRPSRRPPRCCSRPSTTWPPHAAARPKPSGPMTAPPRATGSAWGWPGSRPGEPARPRPASSSSASAPGPACSPPSPVPGSMPGARAGSSPPSKTRCAGNSCGPDARRRRNSTA